MTPVEDVPALWSAFRNRWNARDERMYVMDQVVTGEWQAVDPNGDPVDSRSPNLIQVALEDTAESAATVPTIRVRPSGGTDTAHRNARMMEQLGTSYFDLSQIELKQIQDMLDLGAFGFYAGVVVYDKESKSPRIEHRDPRLCYPEAGWRAGDSVRRCMFAREVYVSQLDPSHQALVKAEMGRVRSKTSVQNDQKVTLIDFYEEDTVSLFALYTPGALPVGDRNPGSMHPVLLDRAPTAGGICPVVIAQRPTLDGEPRGQFDQVVGVMQAHIRLMGLVLDYSDQAVYSDVWVRDLIGEMAYGGGSYIQLGPNGSIGRVAPAVSSLTVQQELDALVTNIHLGGRWPKSRPGEVDQAIASAKFIEATAGMMNTVIRTMHLVSMRYWSQALRIAFLIDKEMGPDRTVAGVLRNQQFLTERRKQDIDLGAQVKVDYGIGLGRDQGQAMVLGIQGMQNGLLSKEFVQENFDGITDVAREQERVDVQQLTDMMMAQLLQGLQGGSIPNTALVEIIKARRNHESTVELFEKYVAAPQQQTAAAAIPSGLGGPTQQPGALPPGAGGPLPPQPPSGADLLGGLPGAGGPPPTQSQGRLSIPLPGRGFASTQFGG